MEAIEREAKNNSRYPGRAVCTRERSRQTKGTVAGEDEAKQFSAALHGKRAHSEGKEREHQQRDSIMVFAEGKCVVIRKENWGLKQIRGIVKRLEIIPPENPAT